MSKEEYIRNGVVNCIQKWVPHVSEISDEMRIIKDIGMESDDSSFFAQDVENLFRINIPAASWKCIYTVGQLIDELSKRIPD